MAIDVGTRCVPKQDLVLVLADAVEAKTESDGGILLPDDAQVVVIKRTGTVVAIGPETKNTGVGERVLFAAYAGSTIVLNDVEHELMEERHVLAGI